jgi:Acetyltransferase (GNAT) domain
MQGIRYTTQEELDRQQWDNCIGQAANGLVYAHSWYLDAMCRQWHALVLNDYEAVMPLTFNKKYGIHYLYQPPFTASLGIFGKAVTAGMVKDFLNAVPEKFRYIDISLNHGNFFSTEGFELYERSNYILLLNQPYETVYNQYRDNIRRNIKKCVQQGCRVKKDFDVAAVIELAKIQTVNFSTLTETDFANFSNLYQLLHQQQKAITYGICTAKGELVASCVFFFSHGRAYYILVGNHPNGKTMGASHALIDAFIKDHAGSNLLLDFEGSDIRNLAFFYNSFGAKEEKYPGLRMNRLPAILKWLKK